MKRVLFWAAPALVISGLACGEKTTSAEESPVPQIAVSGPSDEALAKGSGEVKFGEEVEAKVEGAVEVATFVVPDLDKSLAANLAKGIAALEGVRRATPRLASGQLDVEFTPPMVTPAAILEKMKHVAPSITLSKVRRGVPQGPEGHACGGCPMQNTCGGF